MQVQGLCYVCSRYTAMLRAELGCLQRLVSIIIGGSLSMVPTTALEVYFSLLPLHLAVETDAWAVCRLSPTDMWWARGHT
jgi:hypothetical protein